MWKHFYGWLVARSFWQSYWRTVLVSYPLFFVAFYWFRFVPDKLGYRHDDPLSVYAMIVLFATLIAGFRMAYAFKDERKEKTL